MQYQSIRYNMWSALSTTENRLITINQMRNKAVRLPASVAQWSSDLGATVQ